MKSKFLRSALLAAFMAVAGSIPALADDAVVFSSGGTAPNTTGNESARAAWGVCSTNGHPLTLKVKATPGQADVDSFVRASFPEEMQSMSPAQWGPYLDSLPADKAEAIRNGHREKYDPFFHAMGEAPFDALRHTITATSPGRDYRNVDPAKALAVLKTESRKFADDITGRFNIHVRVDLSVTEEEGPCLQPRGLIPQ